MSQHNVTLLLGSNIGSPELNIAEAVTRIGREVGVVEAQSALIHTEPVEFVTNNNFCNIALRIKTGLSPISLLNRIKKIEVEMGRAEDSLITKKYEDRIIDIDVVLYGDIKFLSARLQIPHQKHLYERKFSRELLSDLSNTLKTQI